MSQTSFRHLFVAVLVCVSTVSGMSQDWNTARLNVLYGSSIPFNFTSIDKIKNGLGIPSGTIFGVSMSDSTKVYHGLSGFTLNCRTFNNATNIKGESSSLPLYKIRIKAENNKGLGAGVSNGYTDLSSDWTPLFLFTNQRSSFPLDWSKHQLIISYECGKPSGVHPDASLMGEDPDYYNVEIEFELVPTGTDF